MVLVHHSVMKVVYYGSSFVRRLSDYHRQEIELEPWTSEFYGRGGLRLTSVTSTMVSELVARRADVYVLHLGANDISPTQHPRYIIDELLSLAEDLTRSGARVMVLELLPRHGLSKVPGLTCLPTAVAEPS